MAVVVSKSVAASLSAAGYHPTASGAWVSGSSGGSSSGSGGSSNAVSQLTQAPQNALTQAMSKGTYNPSTGVYTSPSGVKQSMVSAPQGAVIVSSGSSNAVSQLTQAPQNALTQAMANAPAQQQSVAPKSFISGIISKAQSTWDTITGKDARQLAEQRESSMLSSGRVEVPFTPSGRGTITTIQRDFSNADLERGAISGQITIPKSAITNTIITETKEVSRGTALNVLAEKKAQENAKLESNSLRLYAEGIEMKSKAEANKLVQNEQSNINSLQNKLQEQVSKGLISVNDANEQLKSAIDLSNQKLSSFSDTDLSKRQVQIDAFKQRYEETTGKRISEETNKYLENIQKKAFVSKVIEYAPFAVIGGLATGGTLSLAAATIGTGAVVGTAALDVIGYAGAAGAGASIGFTGGKVLADIIYKSQDTKIDAQVLGATILENALFFGGAYAGSKIVTGESVNKLELNKALDRANVVKKSEGITNEIQIRKLDIPEVDKIKLIEQLNSGNAMKIVKADIQAANSVDAKLIEKGLPERNIEFIQVTNKAGNVIDAALVGKVEVSKGVLKYKNEVVGLSKGTLNQQTGISDISTLTGIKGKNIPERIIGTRSLSKSTSQISEGNILTRTKSINVKYGEFQQEEFKLTERQKMDLTSGRRSYQEVYNEARFRYESKQADQLAKLWESSPKMQSTSEGIELNELKETIMNINKLPEELRVTTDKSFNKEIQRIEKSNPILVSTQKKYLSTGASVTTPRKESISFEINPSEYYSAKSGTPFEMAKGSEQEKIIKNIEKSSQVFEKLEQNKAQQLKLKELEINGLDTETAVKESLKSIQQQVQENKLLFGMKMNQQQEKLLNENLIFNEMMPQIKQEQIQNQLSIQQLSQQQVKQQLQQFNINQLQTQMNIPQIQIPNIEIPIIPPIPSFAGGLGGGGSLGRGGYNKEQKKAEKEYAADIESAFLGITKNVSPEEYKQLKESTFTGLELRPVINIVTKKGGSTQEGTIRNLQKAIKKNQDIIQRNKNIKQIKESDIFK